MGCVRVCLCGGECGCVWITVRKAFEVNLASQLDLLSWVSCQRMGEKMVIVLSWTGESDQFGYVKILFYVDITKCSMLKDSQQLIS